MNNNNFYARVCIAIPRIEFKIVAESIYLGFYFDMCIYTQGLTPDKSNFIGFIYFGILNILGIRIVQEDESAG